MPAAIKYIDDPNSKDSINLETAYTREINARQKQYKSGWDYYYGRHKQHLRDDGTNTQDNVTINLCELLLDKGVSSLMGTSDQGAIRGPDFEVVQAAQPPTATAAPANTESDNPSADWLDKVWEVNSKAILLHDLAL